MLQFLGVGSAFNIEDYNTSAYYKENGKMLLIDCGETVFEQIIKNGVLDDVNNINLLISHTHTDHVGSLGTLIYYLFYEKNIIPNIIINNDLNYIITLEQFLKIVGVNNRMYNFCTELGFKFIKDITFIEADHDHSIPCYSFVLNFYNEKKVFYSGDSKNLQIIIDLLQDKNVLRIYTEICKEYYDGIEHLHIDRLLLNTTFEERQKITCMHYDYPDIREILISNGLNKAEKTKQRRKV